MDLIGKTVSYTHNGITYTRQVRSIIRREDRAVYRLFDPVNKVLKEAYVSIFNKMFQGAGGKILPKGTRTKIIGKQKNVGQ